jgi:hypothetical protein
MKHQVHFRVIVAKPLAGVAMQVQRGKDEPLPPSAVSGSAISFEFDITVDVTAGPPNFLSKYARGPKDARFVYVNSGKYAGQTDTDWARRAKLSLMAITSKQIQEIIAAAGSCVETTMPGTGGDGGPTCASVKGLEWKVVKK